MSPYIYVYGCVYHLILYVPRGILSITMEHRCGQYSVTNCRNVGVMFLPSIFEDRCVDLRRSRVVDASTFENRCRPSKIDVSTFEDRRSMCRPSRIEGGRCIDLRKSMSTFKDRCVDFRRSMCRLLKIDDRCVDFRRSTIDVSTFEDR